MKAHELIATLEELLTCPNDGFIRFHVKPVNDILDTLQQQQSEIESLRLQLSTVLANRNLRTYDGRLE